LGEFFAERAQDALGEAMEVHQEDGVGREESGTAYKASKGEPTFFVRVIPDKCLKVDSTK